MTQTSGRKMLRHPSGEVYDGSELTFAYKEQGWEVVNVLSDEELKEMMRDAFYINECSWSGDFEAYFEDYWQRREEARKRNE